MIMVRFFCMCVCVSSLLTTPRGYQVDWHQCTEFTAVFFSTVSRSTSIHEVARTKRMGIVYLWTFSSFYHFFTIIECYYIINIIHIIIECYKMITQNLFQGIDPCVLHESALPFELHVLHGTQYINLKLLTDDSRSIQNWVAVSVS